MQSVAYASSCFAVMFMNVGSKLIPALVATSLFARTAYPHLVLDAPCVLFNGVKGAGIRAYAIGVIVLTAGIAKENEENPILIAKDVSKRLLLSWWERTSS